MLPKPECHPLTAPDMMVAYLGDVIMSGRTSGKTGSAVGTSFGQLTGGGQELAKMGDLPLPGD